MNYLRTTLLMAVMMGLFLVIGHAIGGNKGMVIAFIIAMAMNFGAYWFSDRMVLSTYNAQEVTPEEAPELYEIVRDLAQKAHMPMPKIYIVQEDNPNAFATGRSPNHAVVAVTTGILKILNYDELKGVLAHELSHVRHRDMLTSAIAATLAGAIAMLAHMAQFATLFGGGRSSEEGGSQGGGILSSLVLMIVAPIAATLIQLAVSRSREYGADEGGAKLSGNPLSLASALSKLEQVNQDVPLPAADEHPTTAHLFIINPLRPETIQRLFSTHPPTEERIRRLKEMAAGKW